MENHRGGCAYTPRAQPLPTALRAELSYDGPSHPTCPDMGAPTNNVVPSHNNA